MKGIILAGGKGTRLNPLTEVTNKHLLPVGLEPMIWHCVRQLCSAGITEIMVITSTEHMGDIVNSLGSGARFDCEFSYRVQETAGGIADALSLCHRFAKGDKMVVLLGDNVFEHTIAPHVHAFENQGGGARVFLKKVEDPQRYGVAALDEKHVIEIEEKPENPKSNYAVIGCYMYGPEVFDVIKTIKPSGRGELEITDVNNHYIKENALQYSFVEGRWTDAGTFESLAEANRILLDNENRILS